MTLSAELLIVVAALVGLWGLVFLFFPRGVTRIEEKLNTAWGGREVLSIRLGVPGERPAERVLNRPVLARAFYWDRWAHSYPRLTGAAMCLSAALLFAFAAGG